MEDPTQPEAPRSRLHPRLCVVMAVLAAVYVLVAWSFAGNSRIGLDLAVASFFGIAALFLLSVLARFRRRRPGQAVDGEIRPSRSFRDWAHGEFATSEGLIKSRLAALEVLVPIVAAVVCLIALAIVRGIVA